MIGNLRNRNSYIPKYWFVIIDSYFSDSSWQKSLGYTLINNAEF